MIIFGRKYKSVGGYTTQATCPHCQREDLLVHLFRGYVHVFWIPFLPFGRLAMLSCDHCKWTADAKEFAAGIDVESAQDRDAKEQLKALRSQAKTPWYLWTGLALLLIGGGVGFMFDHMEQQALSEWTAKPSEKTIIIVKSSNQMDRKYPYQVLYVESITGDTARVLAGRHGFSHLKGAKAEVEVYRKAILNGDIASQFEERAFDVDLSTLFKKTELQATFPVAASE